MSTIEKLRKHLLVISKLGSATALLGWDQEVNLPPKGQAFRGEVLAQLAGELHKLSTDKAFVGLVRDLYSPASMKQLSGDEQVIVREVWRDIEKSIKLPQKFVEDFTKLTSQAFGAWSEARQKSDFKVFEPVLKKIITMSRKQSELLGYRDSPYDALLDQYEPGLTSSKVESLFRPLAKELSVLVKNSRDKKQAAIPPATYEVAAQEKLSLEVAKTMGYDLDAGRLDTSPHPFTIDFHPTDVRITTRYSKNNFWESLGSTIHETGHALYQQGLPAKEFGTPLCEPISLGVHESQSRIWENFVGKSMSFATYLHPLLIKYFGNETCNFSVEELHAWLNRVEPNFIRVESDEVTYNLHIVLRFEIEKALIEGSLDTADIPRIWNQKMKEYLGLEVPDDAKGCLQDVHWSHGSFGYFPTYTLGNLYAAQIYNKVKNDIPGLEDKFAEGDFSEFLAWQRREIHVHGRRYQPEVLLEKATGEPLDPSYLVAHLKSKLI